VNIDSPPFGISSARARDENPEKAGLADVVESTRIRAKLNDTPVRPFSPEARRFA
jgi:hypothetical protein